MSGINRTLAWFFVMFVATWGTIFSTAANLRARTEIPELVRDFVILVVAHNRAGERIPFSVDYDREDTFVYRDIETNSVFLVEMAYCILPYYAYEMAVTNEKMPEAMMFEHVAGDRSFHLLGWAYVGTPEMDINERILSDPAWNDLRLFYEVVIHEMLHLQRYLFSGGSSQEVEAHAVAATLEISAGASIRSMDDDFEKSFWYQVEGLAANSLRARLHKNDLDWLYDLVMDVCFRDHAEELKAEKSGRYWASQPLSLWDIIINYGQYPWEEYVLPGVLGQRMLVRDYEYEFYGGEGHVTSHMPFDDTEALFGDILMWIIEGTTDDGGAE